MLLAVELFDSTNDDVETLVLVDESDGVAARLELSRLLELSMLPELRLELSMVLELDMLLELRLELSMLLVLVLLSMLLVS